MFKRTLTQSDIFLIVANLLPVFGVWFWNWNPMTVFIVYCLETIIIGFFNLLKMGIATAYRKTDIWYNGNYQARVSGIFFMLFFLVHYGMFVAIQMGLFFAVSGLADQFNIGFFSFFFKWPQLIGSDAYIMIGAFVLSYGYKTVSEFLLTGQYRRVPLGILMFQPYMRIFVQQVTVILGSMFLAFGAGKIFILVFALVKIVFEVYVNYEGLMNKAIVQLKRQSGK
ncbi:MAG: hypothetical protein E6H06_00225 [Bacteroidetes bacterium]|nr:MAG: hypothetical protein E6H06_00225 [Bacteroidota bacterium]